MTGADPLADRRQRAREAYWDRYSLGDNLGGSARKAAIREAIETATRVKITADIRWAAVMGVSKAPAGDIDAGMTAALTAAFRAAGFEVEE